MNSQKPQSLAFGAPGIEPRWTSSAKEGVGTAYHTSFHLWFTISHGTGAAMPLCWSHAEYVSLVRSHHDGVCFDRIKPVYQRYATARTGSKIEIWTLAHQL